MIETEDQIIVTQSEIDNLVRLIMTSETEDEVKENLIKGLNYIANPKVLIIIEGE